MRAARRVVLVPLVALLHGTVLAVTPLALLCAAVVAVATATTLPVRSVLLVAAYSAVELSLLPTALRPVSTPRWPPGAVCTRTSGARPIATSIAIVIMLRCARVRPSRDHASPKQ